MRLLVFAFAALSGCEKSCPDVSRLDGGYAVYMAPADSSKTAWDEVFASGWTEWDMSYVPARQDFDLTVEGQPYTASYTGDSADCDAFTFGFDGTWLADNGDVHSFTWSGDLKIAGVHIQGTYTFNDNWTDPNTGDQGSLSTQDGSFTANTRSD